ncbi:MAG: cytochrome C [Acidobacteria bacterium]|nr:cytochrome C [Acidobacteriota bacterium]
MRIEFLAAIILTVLLMVWSITLNAPLEEPANPNLTMNPAKAPWYFLGLQEMLVYFQPWMAGVVMPTLIIIGLMAIPYIDTNPLGSGYYTWKQRKFAIGAFCFGFLILWVTMIIIGTFIRGPGWMWFWPGQTWDPNRLEYAVNRDLHDIVNQFLPGFLQITSAWGKIMFGAVVMGIYTAAAGWVIHKIITATEFNRKIYKRMNLLQYVTMQILLITMLLLPIKILGRLILRINYIWVTPWFSL